MNALTTRALAAFREELVSEANRQWEIVVGCAKRGEKSARRYIATDKMLRSSYDAYEVHAMLGNAYDLSRDLLEVSMLDIIKESLGDKAELAYQAAEDRMEDAALSRFHAQAFGH